jgi:hypothetical protein
LSFRVGDCDDEGILVPLRVNLPTPLNFIMNNYIFYGRILNEKKVRSSALNIGNKTPVVCFTQNCPIDMRALFSYRTRKHRMNFEPYGIGVKKEFAAAKGVEPIKYGGKADWNTMNSFENWKEEKEWRCKGDFIFDKECLENSIVVVRKRDEINSIKEIFNGKVIPFET